MHSWACVLSSVDLSFLALDHVCAHVHIKVDLEFLRQGTSYDIVYNISTTNVIIMVDYANSKSYLQGSKGARVNPKHLIR